MFVIGLTGSIGMGKSTVAAQLAALGAKICSADDIVHALMRGGGAAVPMVQKHFPSVVNNGAVDRKALGAIVFFDKQKLHTLERILHPLVVAAENRFIRQQARLGAKLVVLEIPLLYETGAQKRCDMVIVVTAPPFLQRQRVMRRPGMSEETFQRILRAQIPDRIKRERADQIVHTGLGKAHSFSTLAVLVSALRSDYEA